MEAPRREKGHEREDGTLPDLLRWVEPGFPRTRALPGLHGTRVAECHPVGPDALRAGLAGVGPAGDGEVTVSRACSHFGAARLRRSTRDRTRCRATESVRPSRAHVRASA
ncbi:hypothetical protein GCM10010515_51180 [Streptomyces fructofermentans]|uniref:Uncharacterized protein n=1 Tax=Streptomyces fructofermentans TaxID=152141 RepID=A0A918NKW8_9ACTN|nr:hypothetical protein GCM10010515_51180 [Streptomyces fructofermentans]